MSIRVLQKKILLLLLAATVSGPASLDIQAQKSGKHVVVIDAGHGGKDPGAIGKSFREKAINLKVALKLGRLLEEGRSDVTVVYTRKTDTFIALDRRAQIANEAKADLFISIHTNALAKNHTMTGTSTYTLGLAKSEDNLDVAKRENGVILYESDYERRYEGFDPSSSESYIIFELMQDQYLSHSVKLASLVQGQFKDYSKRPDKGVHQAGFLVLKESAMPSVLVELGFISTPQEERFLGSETGSTSMATSLFRAVSRYLDQTATLGGTATVSADSQSKGQDGEGQVEAVKPEVSGRDLTEAIQGSAASAPSAGSGKSAQDTGQEPVFKIQFLTAAVPLKEGDRRLKGLTNVSYYKEDGILKYTYAQDTDYNAVRRAYTRDVRPKFKDAFIIAFKNGKKYDVQEAIREFRENRAR